MHDENSSGAVPTLNEPPMKVPARIPDWLDRAAYLESDSAAQALSATDEQEQDEIREQAEIEQVRARLQSVGERLDQLDESQLDQAIGDAELFWDTYSTKTHQLRAQIEVERLRRTGGDSHDEHAEQPVTSPSRAIPIGGFR